MGEHTGQVAGYVRVSSKGQSTARQDLGDDVDRIFEDKASGKDRSPMSVHPGCRALERVRIAGCVHRSAPNDACQAAPQPSQCRPGRWEAPPAIRSTRSQRDDERSRKIRPNPRIRPVHAHRFFLMPDEEVHELGREGVGMVKAWLEATTWMEFPFNSNEDGDRCTVLLLEGKKKFDLRGFHLGDKNTRRIMTVECKRYTTKGGQAAEFQRFLAIAYSYHARHKKDYGKAQAEDFLWVTSNPFKTDGWSELCSESSIIAAVKHPKHVDVIGEDHEIDDEIVRLVAQHLWLLVFDQNKQMQITLTRDELKRVMAVVDREGPLLWQH